VKEPKKPSTDVYISIWKEVKIMPEFKLSKSAARANFVGSERLFNSCWRKYREFINGAIYEPEDQDEVDQWLDYIAEDKVNNPCSSFYIFGG
jgi:muramidase (phage lysozyme)